MAFDQGATVSVGLACIGFIFWLARLEGRVNSQEQRHADLKADVSYIRQRIDEALDR